MKRLAGFLELVGFGVVVAGAVLLGVGGVLVVLGVAFVALSYVWGRES
jgi:hypothetical protein